MPERPSYKETLFDRLGPDAAHRYRAFGWGLIAGGLSFPMWVVIGVKVFHLGFGTLLLFSFAGFVVTWLGSARAAIFLADSAEKTWNEVMISGNSTPYTEQHSYQQALVMQGRLDEALASLEAVIAEPLSTVDVRIRAAELYTREAKRHDRAAELFREAIRHPKCTPGEEIYSANRLVDLLNGPLEQPGRALVELRRLADRYANTRAGDNARQALRSLKFADATVDPFAPPTRSD